MLTGTGHFAGVNGHEMRGAFHFVPTAPGYRLETCDDFYFDAKAPRPTWALGDRTGKRIAGAEFCRFNPFVPLNGRQMIVLPETANVASAESIVIWCKTLNIELGVGLIRHWTSRNGLAFDACCSTETC